MNLAALADALRASRGFAHKRDIANVMQRLGPALPADGRYRIGTGPLQAVVERVSPGPGRWEVVMTAHETIHAHLPLDQVPPRVGERVSVSFDAVTLIP